MVIEIVGLPIKNGNCPSFFVCLPEGKILDILGRLLQFIMFDTRWRRSLEFVSNPAMVVQLLSVTHTQLEHGTIIPLNAIKP